MFVLLFFPPGPSYDQPPVPYNARGPDVLPPLIPALTPYDSLVISTLPTIPESLRGDSQGCLMQGAPTLGALGFSFRGMDTLLL